MHTWLIFSLTFREFTALCAVYALLRFLTLGCMAEKTSETELIDVCAALFRLVGHTEFDRLASRLLRNLGCTTPEDMWKSRIWHCNPVQK